jgi:hypothetical protein
MALSFGALLACCGLSCWLPWLSEPIHVQIGLHALLSALRRMLETSLPSAGPSTWLQYEGLGCLWQVRLAHIPEGGGQVETRRLARHQGGASLDSSSSQQKGRISSLGPLETACGAAAMAPCELGMAPRCPCSQAQRICYWVPTGWCPPPARPAVGMHLPLRLFHTLAPMHAMHLHCALCRPRAQAGYRAGQPFLLLLLRRGRGGAAL